MDEYRLRMARRLCAAAISTQMGLSLEYTLKTYVSDEPGEFWMGLADFVSRAMIEGSDPSQVLELVE